MHITGLPLFKRQREIADFILKSEAKYHIINASRQSGKSTLLQQYSLFHNLNKKNSQTLYICPTYSLAKNSFNNILINLIDSGVIKNNSITEMYIEFINNSKISFKSSESDASIRGLTCDLLIVDEAAFINGETFNAVMRPTTSAKKDAKVLLASTPKGKNWFYNLALEGMSDQNTNYTYNYSNYKDNKYFDLLEVDDARKMLPEQIFKQEYLAEFIEDSGSVFTNLNKAATIDKFLDGPVAGDKYYCGIDLARIKDFTVAIFLNQKREVVYIYRDQLKDWSIIITNIINLLKKFNAQVYIECNSIGDPIIEQIKKQYKSGSVHPFLTTNKSKQEIIDKLVYIFNTEGIKIPSPTLFEPLYNELGAFSFTYNKKTRNISYGAPSYAHDDCCISLALAVECLKAVKTGQYFIR